MAVSGCFLFSALKKNRAEKKQFSAISARFWKKTNLIRCVRWKCAENGPQIQRDAPKLRAEYPIQRDGFLRSR
jgi:hypothetical protein